MATKSARFDDDGLTLRESLWVRHFLTNGGNATQAAIAAGYKGDVKKRGSRLLQQPHISRVIDRQRKKLLSELDANAARVLKELARIAFLDVRSLFDRNGMPKPIPQLSADAAAAIGSFDFRRTLKKGAVSKFRLWSKPAALEMLGRWLKMWQGQGDSSEQDRLDEVISAIRDAGNPQKRKEKSDDDDEGR